MDANALTLEPITAGSVVDVAYRRIKTLIAEKKPITLALFPHAEHGMTEYEVAPNGERVSTRYAPGYFAMMRDFAQNGQLSGTYGSSLVVKPQMEPSPTSQDRK